MELAPAVVIAIVAGIAIPLMLQTAAIVWWAATINARVATLEQKHVEGSSQNTPHRLAKVEFLIEVIQQQLTPITTKLDQILQNQGPQSK